jgi:hypothetical protein
MSQIVENSLHYRLLKNKIDVVYNDIKALLKDDKVKKKFNQFGKNSSNHLKI